MGLSRQCERVLICHSADLTERTSSEAGIETRVDEWIHSAVRIGEQRDEIVEWRVPVRKLHS